MKMLKMMMMIDIWMVFIMTIAFLEVVLHTTENAFKCSRASLVVPESMVRVRSVSNDKEKEEGDEATTKGRTQMSKLKGIKVPICALVFIVIFWAVGLVHSYSASHVHEFNTSNCLFIDLD